MSSIRNFSTFGFVILCVGFLTLSSCTRPEADKSKMQIALPKSMLSNKYGALSDEKLSHVVINITDGKMTPIVRTWDLCKNGACKEQTSFEIENIDSGSNRLIQVLAIYEDVGTEFLSFYYGDVTQDLTSANSSVTVPVISVGSGAVLTGDISGRYITAVNNGVATGPTGEVLITYRPPANKPALIIEKAQMVDGWFNLFGLSGAGINMEYQMASTTLFGGPVNLDSSVFTPSDSVMKVAVPLHKRERNEGGGSSFEISEPRKSVYGYFTPAGSGVTIDGNFRICRTLDSSPASLRVFDNTGTSLGFQNVSTSFATNEVLANIAAPMTTIQYKGGVLISSGYCGPVQVTAANEYKQFLKILSAGFNDGGRERAARMNVPLAMNAAEQFINVTTSGSVKVIAGRVLPGVESVYNQVEMFKRVAPAANNYRMDSPNCKEIKEKGLENFVSAGSSAISGTGDFSVTSNITLTEASGGVSVVACGIKSNGEIAPIGFFLESHYFSNMGGSPPVPANSWELGTVAFNMGDVGQCFPAWINLKEGSNNYNVTNGAVKNFTLSITPAAGTASLYTDPNCASSHPSGDPISMAANTTKIDFYYKFTSGGGGSTLNVTAAIAGFGPSSLNFGKDIATSLPIVSFMTVHGDTLRLAPNECREIDVYFVGANNRVSNLNYSSSPAPAWTLSLGWFDFNAAVYSPAGVGFVDNCVAKNPASFVSVGASLYKTKIAISNTGSGDVDFKAVMSSVSNQPGASPIASSIYMNPTQVADHLQLTLPTQPTIVGFCYQAVVTAKDNTNTTVAVPANKKAKIKVYSDVPGSSFYTDAGCTTGAAQMFDGWIDGATSEKIIYWKSPSTGSGYIGLQPSFSLQNPLLNTSPIPVTINP